MCVIIDQGLLIPPLQVTSYYLSSESYEISDNGKEFFFVCGKFNLIFEHLMLAFLIVISDDIMASFIDY